MDEIWKTFGFIGPVVLATAGIIAKYYTDKKHLEDRIRDIERKIEQHEKYVKLMEEKSLSWLNKSIDDSGSNK